jgi:hypothetical protein
MNAARIVASVRAGRLRLSFHVSTSEHEVDTAIDILHRHDITSQRRRVSGWQA